MGTKFEAGKTYWARSMVDADSIIRETITKRTSKTVRVASGRTFRVKELDGVEYFMPWGNYSLSPMIMADRMER